MEYDVFICHASEDKGFVEPLAQALSDKGLKVWYDRFELKIGDRLRQKIDHGLANSRYGIVVLSKVFFEKGWPQSELDALESRQNEEGRKVILPIWHDIKAEEVHKRSPLLGSLLAARSCDGQDYVVSQILDVCSEKGESAKRSVFQTSDKTGLREQCLDVIRNGDLLEWRKLVDKLQQPIEGNLIKWKDFGESSARQGAETWRKAIIDAVEICLPGFVPLFAAIESGRKDYFKESVHILHKLSLLEQKMGGGIRDVLRIGWNLLYVAGNIGMAIAVQTRQFDFIQDWMRLKMPDYRGSDEMLWMKIRPAFFPSIKANYKEPFQFSLDLYETENVKGFFQNKEQMKETLFKANLLQSIIELRILTQTERGAEIVEQHDSKYKPDIVVSPFWVLIDPKEFNGWTWDLFGSSEGFIEFFSFPRAGHIEKARIWNWWKGWKILCAGLMEEATQYSAFVQPEWLTLPGEPVSN